MSAIDHPNLKEYFQDETISGTSDQNYNSRDKVNREMRKIVTVTKEAYEKQKLRLEKLVESISKLEKEYNKIKTLKANLGEITQQLKFEEKEKQHEMKRLHDDRTNSNRAQKLLATKLREVALQSSRVKSELRNIKDTQRTFSTEIEALRKAENDMYGNVVQINRKTTNLGSELGNIKNMDSDIKNELLEMGRNSHKTDMQIEKLRKDIITRKEEELSLKPEVAGVEKNQKTLAKALQAIAHKVEKLGEYLSGFEKTVDTFSQKMTTKIEDEKELAEAVKSITTAMKEMRIDVNKLLNPQSSLNMERSQGLLKMKSDVSLLSSALHQLQQDNKGEKMDMTNLVRDLANVQLSSQDMKNQLGIVARASKQLQAMTNSIQEAERQKPSVVEVAQMHKRVLVALKAMENKEAHLLDKVEQYQQAVNQIATRVRDAQEGNSKIQRAQFRYDESIKQMANKLIALNSKVEGLKLPLKFNEGKGGLKSKVLIDKLVDFKDELHQLEGAVAKLKHVSPVLKPIIVPETESKPLEISPVPKPIIVPETESKPTLISPVSKPIIVPETESKPTEISPALKHIIVPETEIKSPEIPPVLKPIIVPETDSKSPELSTIVKETYKRKEQELPTPKKVKRPLDLSKPQKPQGIPQSSLETIPQINTEPLSKTVSNLLKKQNVSLTTEANELKQMKRLKKGRRRGRRRKGRRRKGNRPRKGKRRRRRKLTPEQKLKRAALKLTRKGKRKFGRKGKLGKRRRRRGKLGKRRQRRKLRDVVEEQLSKEGVKPLIAKKMSDVVI
ncbi:protein Spindly [Patella vulgata]|uniref:protein Spindly n=1 Tax=Patella vulgata TaxID=6465 RepID=UPI0021803DF1|nr:protein Spindly [Patella vulgata]